MSDVVAVALIFGVVTVLVVGMVLGLPIRATLSRDGLDFESQPPADGSQGPRAGRRR